MTLVTALQKQISDEIAQPTHRHWAKRWPNVIASIGERLQYYVGPKLK